MKLTKLVSILLLGSLTCMCTKMNIAGIGRVRDNSVNLLIQLNFFVRI